MRFLEIAKNLYAPPPCQGAFLLPLGKDSTNLPSASLLFNIITIIDKTSEIVS